MANENRHCNVYYKDLYGKPLEFNWKSAKRFLPVLERFTFECRRVIGFRLSTHTIGLKRSRQFSSNQKYNQNQL